MLSKRLARKLQEDSHQTPLADNNYVTQLPSNKVTLKSFLNGSFNPIETMKSHQPSPQILHNTDQGFLGAQLWTMLSNIKRVKHPKSKVVRMSPNINEPTISTPRDGPKGRTKNTIPSHKVQQQKYHYQVRHVNVHVEGINPIMSIKECIVNQIAARYQANCHQEDNDDWWVDNWRNENDGLYDLASSGVQPTRPIKSLKSSTVPIGAGSLKPSYIEFLTNKPMLEIIQDHFTTGKSYWSILERQIRFVSRLVGNKVNIDQELNGYKLTSDRNTRKPTNEELIIGNDSSKTFRYFSARESIRILEEEAQRDQINHRSRNAKAKVNSYYQKCIYYQCYTCLRGGNYDGAIEALANKDQQLCEILKDYVSYEPVRQGEAVRRARVKWCHGKWNGERNIADNSNNRNNGDLNPYHAQLLYLMQSLALYSSPLFSIDSPDLCWLILHLIMSGLACDGSAENVEELLQTDGKKWWVEKGVEQQRNRRSQTLEQDNGSQMIANSSNGMQQQVFRSEKQRTIARRNYQAPSLMCTLVHLHQFETIAELFINNQEDMKRLQNFLEADMAMLAAVAIAVIEVPNTVETHSNQHKAKRPQQNNHQMSSKTNYALGKLFKHLFVPKLKQCSPKCKADYEQLYSYISNWQPIEMSEWELYGNIAMGLLQIRPISFENNKVSRNEYNQSISGNLAEPLSFMNEKIGGLLKSVIEGKVSQKVLEEEINCAFARQIHDAD